MPTKAELVEEAEAAGIDVPADATKAEIEALLGKNDVARVCPNCGNLHGSSIVPEAEIDQLEGVKLSALPKASYYRVFRCGEAFHVVTYEGGS